MESWILDRVALRSDVKLTRPLRPATLADGTLIAIETRWHQHAGFWRAMYQHPDENDSNKRWRTTVSLATLSGDPVEMTLHVANGYEGRVLDSYAPETLGRPLIVKRIFEEYVCGIENQRLSNRSTHVDSGQVDDVVDRLILNANRALPFVMIAPDANGEYFAEPDKIADYLSGLAIVAHLGSTQAAMALTDRLSSRLSVFDGGIRLYWPRMSLNDSPYRHPLWTRYRLSKIPYGLRYRSITYPVMEMAANLTWNDGTYYRRVQQALLQVHWNEYREKGEAAKAALDAMKKLSATQVSDLAASVQSLLDELSYKESRIEELELERDGLRQAFYAYQRDIASRTAAEVGEEEPATPQTVEEALSAASRRHPILLIWDSAWKAAAKSGSNRAARLSETLDILAEVANDYFAARRDGKGLGMTLEDVFHQKNTPKYAAQDSPTTTTKHGKDRTFIQDGRKVFFKKHFTIAGRPQDCLQIYFEFDEERDRVDVGYVGPHLPFANDGS